MSCDELTGKNPNMKFVFEYVFSDRNPIYRKSSITTAPSNTAAAVLYLYSNTTAPLRAQSVVLFIYSITTAPSNRAAAAVLEFRIEPRRL